MMPTDIHDNDADLWLNLKSRVSQFRDQLKPLLTWYFPIHPETDRNVAQHQWIERVLHYRVPIDDSIEAWIKTGSVTEPEDHLRFFLCARFDAAHDLLTYLTFVKDGEWATIFPFPAQQPSEVLRFLLKDWWYGMGMFLFFDRYCKAND
jgi:hypothetical protein